MDSQQYIRRSFKGGLDKLVTHLNITISLTVVLILSSLSRYAFCRVADDLIDEDARTVEEGRSVLSHIRAFVNRFYSSEIRVGHEGSQFDDLLAPLKLSVSQRRAFFALPRTRWPSQTSPSNTANSESLSSPPAEDPLREPLLELLDGFDTDLVFKELANDSDSAEGMERVLVRNNEDLERTLTHTSMSNFCDFKSAHCYP